MEVVAVTLIALFIKVNRASAPTSSSLLLAPAPSLSSQQPIDSIPCSSMEQVAYHVHAHLAIYVDGKRKLIPEGVGIAAPRQTQGSNEGPFVVSGSCFYWLHTHTNDGVIHIEAPQERAFTLGQFFDVWQQPLGESQAGPAHGQVYAYVNSAPYTGDPRGIPLASHVLIQLDVGSNEPPPQPFTFPQGL